MHVKVRVAKIIKLAGKHGQEFAAISETRENVPHNWLSISFTGNRRLGFFLGFSMDRRAWADCVDCFPKHRRRC